MTKFIILRFDLHCDWEHFAPTYRIYVNDEMFMERAYKARRPTYYKEKVSINAPPGKYKIQVVPNDKTINTFIMSNTVVENGDGKVLNVNEIEII